jgi:Leucine-rich repeat (LRR) protein
VERIWLNNNQIEHIKLFDRLPMLRHLFLGSNKINKIRGLEKCVQLEKLWLDDNRIEHIEGLQNLSLLMELNMAQNNIEVIGIGLDGLISLRELNLSANRIGNFKEVLNLNRLPNLSSCNFIDPHYGENPICSLCNYQTYVLFHLPKLQKLDTLLVSEESKSFAETTFMKKRMYYNMRIKTIQRNTSNIMKLLKIC